MKEVKRVWKIFYWVLLCVLILVAGLTALSTLDIKGNYKLLVVQSGSMEPVIGTGSIVIIKPQDAYRVGDIVTSIEPANIDTSLTHRVVAVEKTEKETFYTTKGDANKNADTEKRPEVNVIGKVLFSIPFVGYFVDFAKTQAGLIVIIVISALIIYNELIGVRNELSRILAKKRGKKLNLEERIEEKIDKEIITVEEKIKKAIG